MQQMSLASGFEVSSRRTRKRVFLEEMDRVVPWQELVALIEIEPRYWGKASTGRPPFACELMLRIHFLQQWFGHSDPAMEGSLHDVTLYGVEPGLCIDIAHAACAPLEGLNHAAHHIPGSE